MPDAGQVPRELAGGDRVVLLRKGGDVALDRSVEVETAGLGQPGRGGDGEELRDAPQPEAALRGDRNAPLGVRLAEPLRPDDLAVHGDRRLKARALHLLAQGLGQTAGLVDAAGGGSLRLEGGGEQPKDERGQTFSEHGEVPHHTLWGAASAAGC